VHLVPDEVLLDAACSPEQIEDRAPFNTCKPDGLFGCQGSPLYDSLHDIVDELFHEILPWLIYHDGEALSTKSVEVVDEAQVSTAILVGADLNGEGRQMPFCESIKILKRGNVLKFFGGKRDHVVDPFRIE
jgi:hypothetical protein